MIEEKKKRGTPISKNSILERGLDFWESDMGGSILAGMARSDMTDSEISKEIGVALKTFKYWVQNSEKVRGALLFGKDDIIKIAESALIDALKPQKHVLREWRVWNNELNCEVKYSEKLITPSGDLIKYALNNWEPDRYRSKVEIAQDVNSDLEQTIKEMTELAKNINKPVAVLDDGLEDEE